MVVLTLVVMITTSVHLIPSPPVDAVPCTRREFCTRPQLIDRLRSIAAQRKPGAEAEKIFIEDSDLPLTASERRAAGDDFVFGWWVAGVEEQRQKTKEAAVVVELLPPGFTAALSRDSFPPFIQLSVGEEEELAKYADDDTDRKRNE